MTRQPLSLRARAVTLLAQRDHSELELRRKLGRIAMSSAASTGGAKTDDRSSGVLGKRTARRRRPDETFDGASYEAHHEAHDAELHEPIDAASEEVPDPAHIEQQVDEVLVWLRQQGYLDESRFVESRLNARASRWGQRRIEQELAQHGLSLDAEQRSALSGTELDRACEVLRRKFSAALPWDAAQEARQMRFLMGRGFQSDVARRAIRAVRAALAAMHSNSDGDADGDADFGADPAAS
ncbi:regulatory protein RecX [Roseateles depolymerans]|uniref:Regulatory protein RecX n=1 Tax=Roseateles depolymerans TaxID=76731 RepID=A0A0U3CKL3_9BURK|nr:regulatory protein RecX [Roseateles depolymerans]ALV09144.1 hypothetical protein RD2015_4704 [Roseateles depolymerans]REG13899.1 regulatory protein [Roseateles depolymerans]